MSSRSFALSSSVGRLYLGSFLFRFRFRSDMPGGWFVLSCFLFFARTHARTHARRRALDWIGLAWWVESESESVVRSALLGVFAWSRSEPRERKSTSSSTQSSAFQPVPAGVIYYTRMILVNTRTPTSTRAIRTPPTRTSVRVMYSYEVLVILVPVLCVWWAGRQAGCTSTVRVFYSYECGSVSFSWSYDE